MIFTGIKGHDMWKDSYLIGVEQLDAQHKQLVLTLQDLLDSLQGGGANAVEASKHTIDFLKSFVVVHFGAEEMYQQDIGFPLYEEHKKLHEDFIVRVREMEFELMRCGYSRPAMEKLAKMLTKWWIWHIVKEDKKMAAYIPAGGDAPFDEKLGAVGV